MNIPLSWLKDYVDVDLPLEEIARVLTMSGLEVDEVELIGLPGPDNDNHGFKFEGLSWPADKFVVAEIREVNQHPDADKLTLCQLDDGTGEHTILCGAPNIRQYIGQGRLEKPLKVAYVREGGVVYDGHKPGWELTKIKKTKIRGFETKSMVCSAKELGICEEHDGIILLPEDAPTGMPLADYMGTVDGRANPDKMNVDIAIDKGSVLPVPILKDSPVTYELEVKQFIPLKGAEVILCDIRNVIMDEELTKDSASLEEKLAAIAPVSTTAVTYFDWAGKALGGWGKVKEQFKKN